MSWNSIDAETMLPQKGLIPCCPGRPMVVGGKPMSCRATVTGMVFVAECLRFETVAVPMERHSVQMHVLGSQAPAADAH